MILYLDLSNVDLEKLANEGYIFNSDQGTLKIKIIFPNAQQFPLQQGAADPLGADSVLPKDFPTKEDIDFVKNIYPKLAYDIQVPLFRDYYKTLLRTNWSQVWKAWCRRTAEKDKLNASPQNAGRDYYTNALGTLQQRDCDPE